MHLFAVLERNNLLFTQRKFLSPCALQVSYQFFHKSVIYEMMPTHKMYFLIILPHFSVPKDLSFGPILDACKDSFLLKLLMRIQTQQNCEKELSVQRCSPSLDVESICLNGGSTCQPQIMHIMYFENPMKFIIYVRNIISFAV